MKMPRMAIPTKSPENRAKCASATPTKPKNTIIK